MTKYRKKPVVIDAFKWTGGHDQVEDPEWIVEAIDEGVAEIKRLYNTSLGEITEECTLDTVSSSIVLQIKTLEGLMAAQPGDYIIRGVVGEIYPCKPDIFEATYEMVADIKDLPEIEIKDMLLTMDGLQAHADYCLKNNLSLSLLIDMPGFDAPELITNPPENIVKKMAYYRAIYDENCNHKHAEGIRIIACSLTNG